jgi:predicted phage terminase large subunit-like protein
MNALLSDQRLMDLTSKSPAVQRAIMNELRRESLLAFCQAAYAMLYPGKRLEPLPYVQALIYQLERIALGDTRRMICNIPPRHGKSDFGTCMMSAWVLGRDPTMKVFVICYGMGLSTGFARKVRQIVKHPAYQRIFPKTRIRFGDDRSDHFVTTQGGEFRAGSQDGMVTGIGTHLMILDDFQKADAALSVVERESAINTFRNTLVSRFDNLADGRILINQQRLHEEDISRFAASLGTWDHLILPAIAEENQRLPLGQGRIWHRRKGEVLDPIRAPLSYLNELKLMQGTHYFNAQCQQNPFVSDGGMIDLGWFDQYEDMPERSTFLKIVQAWDPAISERFSADYSVGMTWGYHITGKWYLLDLIRAQMAFPTLQERAIAWQRKWRADAIVIEGASIGISLWQALKRIDLIDFILAPTPRGSKVERLAGRSAQLATGDYLLPSAAPWLWDLKRELVAFPDWKHDDQVDALSLFLNFVFEQHRCIGTQYNERGRPISRPPRPTRPRRY